MTAASPSRPARWSPISIAIASLMAGSTLTFIVASLLHFGVALPLMSVDPFSGAALPEAIIAAVLAAGSVSVIARLGPTWRIAVGTTLFALLGVLVGLRFVLFGSVSRPGDVIYHLAILVVLLVTIGLLIAPAARQALRRSP